MDIQKEVSQCYQPLFDLMSNEYGLTLLKSQMDDIISSVEDVKDNLHNLLNTCDVDGCMNEACSGGINWKETGYWRLCHKHSSNKLPQPKMKEMAIQREGMREDDGTLKNFYY